MTLKLMESNNL